jgi:hypothetical protein
MSTTDMTPLAAYRLISQTHKRNGEGIDEAFGVLYKAAELAETTTAAKVALTAARDEVDTAMADGFARDGTTKRHQVVALHTLVRAVDEYLKATS